MANLLVVKNGIAEGVYDDRLLPLYEALGMPIISRASSCEYSPVLGLWVAVDLRTGRKIAYAKKRADCLRDEVAYLEGKLLCNG